MKMFGNTCKCPECKAHNNENRETCRVCGTKLNGSEISNKKEKTKGRIEKLAILAVLLIFVIFVAWVVNLGMNSSTDISTTTQVSTALTDSELELKLEEILTDYGFKVKKIEASGGVVWFDIYNVGALPDYKQKQLIVTLAKLAHRERRGSGGTNVILYDEYGIKIASARHHSIDDFVKDVKLY